jgi:hypothetical protein
MRYVQQAAYGIRCAACSSATQRRAIMQTTKKQLTPLTLRKVNNTLRLSVPHQYVKRFKLEPGDQVAWIEQASGVQLKFFKLKALAATGS